MTTYETAQTISEAREPASRRGRISRVIGHLATKAQAAYGRANVFALRQMTDYATGDIYTGRKLAAASALFVGGLALKTALGHPPAADTAASLVMTGTDMQDARFAPAEPKPQAGHDDDTDRLPIVRHAGIQDTDTAPLRIVREADGLETETIQMHLVRPDAEAVTEELPRAA